MRYRLLILSALALTAVRSLAETLPACGDNGEKTYYRAERLGSYVIYSAHCGGYFGGR